MPHKIVQQNEGALFDAQTDKTRGQAFRNEGGWWWLADIAEGAVQQVAVDTI